MRNRADARKMNSAGRHVAAHGYDVHCLLLPMPGLRISLHFLTHSI